MKVLIISGHQSVSQLIMGHLNIEVAFIMQFKSPYTKSVSSFTTFSTPSRCLGIKRREPGMPF